MREANVYSEVVPHSMSAADMLAKDPAAIVLSGGPVLGLRGGAPGLDPALLEAGVPVFGMCYGFQSMVQALGGTVSKTGLGEYGATPARITDVSSVLFNGQPDEQSVWMSHGDSVTEAPAGMRVTASTAGAPVAFEDDERQLYGVQWHPEVMHSTFGQRVLENFLWRGAGIEGDWTAANVVDELVETIRAQVGESRVLCALSGGVDSSVAAALVQKAVGDQATCVFVDHGLLRAGEASRSRRTSSRPRVSTWWSWTRATGSSRRSRDPPTRSARSSAGSSSGSSSRRPDVVGSHRANDHPVEFLVQGTLYPDVVESGGGRANIKSHTTQRRRPGGRPAVQAGRAAAGAVQGRGAPGRSRAWACRRPSSGASRSPARAWDPIVGEVTASVLEVLRAGRDRPSGADRSGLDRDIWQCPVVLLADVRSVGVQGDGRTYGHPVVRPVSSEDAMTADWTRVPYDVLAKISTRITNEVREVNASSSM